MGVETYSTASWLFLRLLGVVYLFAFWSIAQQITGLAGAEGIAPVAEYLARVREFADGRDIGIVRYWQLPTLFWISSSDQFLLAVPVAGAGLALLLVAGIAPVIVLPLLWIGYLSVVVAGGDFLSYQWDLLLLEAGLLAIFIAPLAWRHRLRTASEPPRVGRWLLWWLLFRLMFASGMVKLASGDATWRGLTALAVHYETQPLPTPLAWYAAQSPFWFQQMSTAMVLGIELLVPWLIFPHRILRVFAAVVLTGLQVLIALTGNYAFFNLLTVALCVMLLDDRALRRLTRLRLPVTATTGRHWRREGPAAMAAALTVPASAAILAGQLGLGAPRFMQPLLVPLYPLRSVNGYGLFAVMTTTRPEIEMEGSRDGVTWRPYAFRYKPGDLERPPPWIAPFQPRLDWQMWFAALGRFEDERWYEGFCKRLLEGSPPVMRMLAHDPFAGKPPRFIRATLYQYGFTNPAMQDTRAWWTRERLGEYSPVMSLEDGVLIAAPRSR